MFNTCIRSTPFVSKDANTYFPEITSNNYNGDISFVSTLRVLMGDGSTGSNERIRVEFGSLTMYTNDISYKAIVMLNTALECPGKVFIVSVKSYDGNKDLIRLLKARFDEDSKFDRLDKITAFYAGAFDVLCYIKPDTKNVLICVENLTMAKMHYLQCSIPAFLPWYFKPEDGIYEYQMELLSSLREKSPVHYQECLTKAAELYNFREKRIKNLLNGFETKADRIECENLKAKIADYDCDIDRYNQVIVDYLTKRRRAEIMLMGYQEKLADSSSESELNDYFMSNKNLVVLDVGDSSIKFQCKGYITYYDEDMAQRVLDKPTSYIYTSAYNAQNVLQSNDAARLMKAVFIDKKIKVRVCATYTIDLYGRVSAERNQVFGSEFASCMPNPHIDRYSCLGDYARQINFCIQEHDYISAIEQCIASCQSLNFGDSVVMGEFMYQIYKNPCTTLKNVQCFELPNGRIVEPIQAILWLREQEENE